MARPTTALLRATLQDIAVLEAYDLDAVHAALDTAGCPSRYNARGRLLAWQGTCREMSLLADMLQGALAPYRHRTVPASLDDIGAEMRRLAQG